MIRSNYSIKNNSKSFFFASLFLKKKQFNDCCALYEFCRYVDDIADKNYKNKKKLLKDIEINIKTIKKNTKLNIIYLIKNKTLKAKNLLELVKGVKMDLENLTFIGEKELINYSYLVAGSVGVMMSNILGCKDKYGYNYAVDLGIAMQLTNMARDILEDAKMGRVYIPKIWLDIKCIDIKNPTEKTSSELKIVTKKLIDLSEEYYKSSMKGLAFLPLRSRFSILIALKVYRQIGLKILKNNFSNILYREKVTFIEKILCLVRCTAIFFLNPQIHIKKYTHKASLHKHLRKKYMV